MVRSETPAQSMWLLVLAAINFLLCGFIPRQVVHIRFVYMHNRCILLLCVIRYMLPLVNRLLVFPGWRCIHAVFRYVHINIPILCILSRRTPDDFVDAFSHCDTDVKRAVSFPYL